MVKINIICLDFRSLCAWKSPSCCLMQSDFAQSSAMSEYFDLAAEGDLFKAPEPIIEEPMIDLDPMNAAISMMSCVENAVSSQGLKPSDSLQQEQLLSDVLKDMLEKEALESPLSEMMEIKVPLSFVSGPTSKHITITPPYSHPQPCAYRPSNPNVSEST